MKGQLIFSARKKDFRIDTFRSGGKGGQHQNATDSGVRITHVETGLSAESRERDSQHQNKKIAFRRVAKLLIDHYCKKKARERYGSAERIRTYHEADNRVVDHLSGLVMPYSAIVGKNNIGPMVEARMMASRKEDR